MDNDKNNNLNIKEDDGAEDGEEKMEDEGEDSTDPVKSSKAFKALVIKTLEGN